MAPREMCIRDRSGTEPSGAPRQVRRRGGPAGVGRRPDERLAAVLPAHWPWRDPRTGHPGRFSGSGPRGLARRRPPYLRNIMGTYLSSYPLRSRRRMQQHPPWGFRDALVARPLGQVHLSTPSNVCTHCSVSSWQPQLLCNAWPTSASSSSGSGEHVADSISAFVVTT